MQSTLFKIATVMIIILFLILVSMFVGYFLRDEDVKPIPTPRVSGEQVSTKAPKETKNKSGEKAINGKSNSGEATIVDIPVVSPSSAPTLKPTTKPEEKTTPKPTIKAQETLAPENTENVISSQSGNTEISNIEKEQKAPEAVITSTAETSNQEKQQVLNELDEALQGLLDVVSKVPTVDESKLDASLGSEVQP